MVRTPLGFVTQGGRYVQKVVSLTLVNNVTLTENINVPAGKMWIIKKVIMRNPDDVARVFQIFTYKEVARTNDLGMWLHASVLANAFIQWPTGTVVVDKYEDQREIILVGGNVLQLVFAAGGASAGGTDADGVSYEYWEIDL